MNKSKTCGIYAIKNKVNNKVYIGSSKSVYYRWKQQHYTELKKGIHCNSHLQNAWNKYGEINFEFQVIEECPESTLIEREGYWIEHYKSWDRQYGYNLIRIVDGQRIITDEIRKKMSEKMLGHTITEETRQKMLKSWEERRPIFWTTGIHKQILDLYKQGISKNKIAKQLNINRETVYSCLEYNGLHKNEGKGKIIKLTSEVRQDIMALRDAGMTWENILNETGISKTQVYRTKVAKDNKYGGGKNIRQTYHTLTPEVKEKAIKLRNERKSWKEIGEILGVSRQLFYWNGITCKQPNMVRNKITPEILNYAKSLKTEGKTWKEIASLIKICRNTLRKYINEN